jgi:hypothetical protein
VPTERQIQKAIDFCAATMVRFHAARARRTRYATIEMIAETQAHAAWILDLGLQSEETAERIFRSVEEELVSRYGDEVGGGLHKDFLKAFDDFSSSLLQASGPRNGMAAANGESARIPDPRERAEMFDPNSHTLYPT